MPPTCLSVQWIFFLRHKLDVFLIRTIRLCMFFAKGNKRNIVIASLLFFFARMFIFRFLTPRERECVHRDIWQTCLAYFDGCASEHGKVSCVFSCDELGRLCF